MGITDLIAGIFRPAATLIDELHTSDDERLQAKGHLLDVQAAAMQRVFDYEKEMIKGQHAIVTAEANIDYLCKTQNLHWLHNFNRSHIQI